MFSLTLRVSPRSAFFVAFCGIFGAALAQQTPAAPTPPAPAPAAAATPAAAPGFNVMVVDVQSLLQNSKAAKMVRQQIEQKRAEYAKEISHQEEVLRHERDTLQRQQATLSAEAAQSKGPRIPGRRSTSSTESVQGKRQALEHSNAEALEKIQEAMLKIITDIAKERKANLVFQRSELVLFDQGFDVTDEVMQKLDEQLPTMSVNFVAPVAANTPAAPAPDEAGAEKEEIGGRLRACPERAAMADPRFFDRAGPYSLERARRPSAGHGCTTRPLGERLVIDVAPLETAGADDVTFLDNRKYVDAFTRSRAGAAFVDERLIGEAPAGMALLLAGEPYKAFARAAQAFYPMPPVAPRRAPSAVIDPAASVPPDCDIGEHVVIEAGARLGARCRIGANTVIAAGVELGDDCRVGANVTLSHCLIGARVVLHPGVRIGQDGFGFAPDPEGPVKVPQLGRVIIGDDVDIGANTTIDRGAGHDTVIGAGTMIDNLVQIGHNVMIGRGCIVWRPSRHLRQHAAGRFRHDRRAGRLRRPSQDRHRRAHRRAGRASCATSRRARRCAALRRCPQRRSGARSRCCSASRQRRAENDRRGLRRGAGDPDRHPADHGDDPASLSVSDDRPGRRCGRRTCRRPASRTSRSTSPISRAISRRVR